MEKSEEMIKENYAENLKAVSYVSMLADAYKDDVRILRIPLMFIHDVMQSGRFKGSRLLEIGSGAVVHNIASASAFFPNIIMSDYVEDNCEELKSWLNGQSSLKQFLDFQAELEGYADNLEMGHEMLKNRIRNSIKQVVRCDVLNDSILLGEVKSTVAPPYDAIISSLCLEAAPPDYEGFILVLKRISKLLRSGGGLILVGFLHGKEWKAGETDFHYIQISKEDLTSALEKSGFGNINMKVHEKMNISYEHEELYCLAAEKM